MNASTAIEFTTEPCFALAAGCTVDAMTPAGHGIAILELADGRLQALWDGHAGEPFDKLAQHRDGSLAISVSDDGEHVAYVGVRDGYHFVGRDADESAPFLAFTRSVPPVFSHGGLHLAYGAGMEPTSISVPSGEPEFRLILDGCPISSEPVAPIQAVFSPSGDRLAFVEIRDEPGAAQEYRIVIDGAPGPWFIGLRNATDAMQFSPDSCRFAYYRIDGRGRAQWVVDGEAQRWTDDVRPLSLSAFRRIGVVEPELLACFSPDSQRFAYFADVDGKGVAVVEDDEEGPRFKGVSMPVFSSDSRHLSYVAKTPSGTFCSVKDGVAGPEWSASHVGPPTFSADSRHTASLYSREEGRFLRKRKTVGCVVDGHVIAEEKGDAYYGDPVFSPDGKHVSWWFERDDEIVMMLDGEPHSPEFAAFSAAVFTPGGHLVYAAWVPSSSGHFTTLVDGRVGPLADLMLPDVSTKAVYLYPRTGEPALPFAVSADGNHVAWAGVFGDEARPVIDDRIGPAFDLIFTARFDTAGGATWWAQRADTICRVTASADGSA